MATILRGNDNLDSADIVKDSTCENDIAPYNKGFKNYFINGNFDIWQRGVSQTSAGYGSDDRWFNANNVSTKTHSQITCNDTERLLFNASKFSRTVVSSVAGASNFVTKRQLIEDVTKLAGKTVTLSFWAKADSNKNIWLEFKQNFGTGGSPSTTVDSVYVQAIALTSTWQKKTITLTLPSIVGKTLGTDGVHRSSTDVQFWFDVGSASTGRIPTGIQQSGTFDIAQVQLEEGTVATPFEQRPIGLELSLCQRYYTKLQLLEHYRTVALNAVDIYFFIPNTTGIIPTTVYLGVEATDWSVISIGIAPVVGFSFVVVDTNNRGVLLKFSKSGHGLTDAVLKTTSSIGYLSAEL